MRVTIIDPSTGDILYDRVAPWAQFVRRGAVMQMRIALGGYNESAYVHISELGGNVRLSHLVVLIRRIRRTLRVKAIGLDWTRWTPDGLRQMKD